MTASPINATRLVTNLTACFGYVWIRKFWIRLDTRGLILDTCWIRFFDTRKVLDTQFWIRLDTFGYADFGYVWIRFLDTAQIMDTMCGYGHVFLLDTFGYVWIRSNTFGYVWIGTICTFTVNSSSFNSTSGYAYPNISNMCFLWIRIDFVREVLKKTSIVGYEYP